MGRILIAAATATLLPLAACTTPDEPARAGPQAAGSERIVVGAQSNVCVSVHVDQDVWPSPLLPDADRNFSNLLASELRRLHEERGGSSFIPGPRQDPRFVAYLEGTNPLCRDAGEDIYVAVAYSLAPNGRPFLLNYRIAQGATVRTGSFSRDVEEEWRSGRLVRIHKTEPLQIAVTDDIRDRAPMIADQLLVGEP